MEEEACQSQFPSLTQKLGKRDTLFFDDYIQGDGSQVLEKDIPGSEGYPLAYLAFGKTNMNFKYQRKN